MSDNHNIMDLCNTIDMNEEESSEEFSKEFASLMKQGFEALMPTIRASNSLPKNQEWDLFCTAPSFKPLINSLGSKALQLMDVILQNQGLYYDIKKRDLEEKYELIVETNDKILERVSTHLDELSGIRRNPVSDISVSTLTTASGSWNRDITNSAAWKEKKLSKTLNTPVVLRNSRVTQRPQVKFVDKIDNSSTPFEPRVKEKPNAMKPLAILMESLPNEETCYSHPYEFELDRFQERICSINLELNKPQDPRTFEETPFLMVTEEDHLMDMLQDLRSQSEIAVDLEHHSYRSFQGFTCLLQISTRDKDYVVDTLSLRHKLYVLNDVFTHPDIVKVFHGAESDIQWLQRDLCLYVVNMFDTYQAALLLSLPRLSLAYLLKTYCNVDANKHFQLYDWRTRPLSKDAIKYAREDTHYLLYIYDVLRNQLIEKSNGGTQLLQTVLFRSADTCKRRYWKSIFKEDSYEHIYRQSKKNFDNRQLYALKELYAWRDKTARDDDESIGYTLPNHMLLLIAEKLPKEMQGILACCNPIPPLVRQNLVLLHQIVLKAREQPLVVRATVGMNSETRIRPTPQMNIDLDGALHCPHDLTQNSDFRNDMPTLLSNLNCDITFKNDVLETKPAVVIFEEMEDFEHSNSLKMRLPNQVHFMSPFERYRKMLTFLETEEQKSKEDKEKEIVKDTQKLLDQCMKERLKLQAAESGISADCSIVASELLNIKEENEEVCLKKKKRDDCQDYSNMSNLIKEETSLGEFNQPPTKKNKVYEDFINKLKSSHEVENEKDTVRNNESNTQSKQKKKLRAQETIPLNVSTSRKLCEEIVCNEKTNKMKKTTEPFTSYDYSQVDYNQYQYTQKPNLLTSKNSQDKFKHKGKKRGQNKSFTFARQYGGSGNKKS